MKKSRHGRLRGGIFYATYLSYGLILYCDAIEDSKQT